jgi:hypothetical protein
MAPERRVRHGMAAVATCLATERLPSYEVSRFVFGPPVPRGIRTR